MWRSMNIANKIFLALSVMVCGFTITIAYGIFMSIENNARLKGLSQVILPASRYSEEALGLFEEQVQLYQDMVATGDARLNSQAQEKAAGLMKALASLESIAPDKRLRTDIDRTRQRCLLFNKEAPEVYEQMRKTAAEYDQTTMERAEGLAAQNKIIHDDLKGYRDHFSRALHAELVGVGSSLWRQSIMSLLIFVLAVGISLVIIVFIVVRVIRSPLQKTIQAFSSGAMGEFSMRLDETARDEFGRLAHFFNTFMAKLEAYNRDLHAEIEGHQRSEEALRKSDELYTRLVDTIPDMIIRTDLEGTIVFVNDYTLELSGYSREEVIGKNVLSFVAPEDLGLALQYTPFAGSTRKGPQEVRLVRKDGRILNIEINGDILRNADGTPFGAVMLCRDITQRKLADQEKGQLQAQLLQAQKMESVGRLAGGVAHDFNNMLSVIIGNAELALHKVDPSNPLHKTLKDILGAGQRSAGLTRQLLAFARKQAVSPKVLDLNDTVAGMLKMLQRLLGEDITLVWMPGKNTWSVRIDPSQVDQILANLTVNARDAMNKAGKIIIETSNRVCDQAYCSSIPECVPGEYVMLAVSDNGCGMDKETLSNIFEPFFTTKQEGHGTGLGLATVYGIVRQNGGFINVYSEPGLGTTFKIYLPRHRPERPDAAGGGMDAAPMGGTETILVVEDEEAVLNLTRDMLESLGYHVLAVKKPEEALRLAAEFQGAIDLLLTDVVMPDMNGKELSERIMHLKPGMQCLYMSGYTADVIARQGMLEEGIHFIPKPFSLQDLAAKIREALG